MRKLRLRRSTPTAAQHPSESVDAASEGPTDADTAVAAAPAKRSRAWWEIPVLIAVAIGLAVGVRTLVVQPFFIPSGSMEKTLHGCPGCSGDRILVNKLIYHFRSPHPGDIVVFHKPANWLSDEAVATHSKNPILEGIRAAAQFVGVVPPDGEILVKRVIATGGETVQGTTSNGGQTEQITVTTNDGVKHVLNEPFVYIDPVNGPDRAATFGPVRVPTGRLWVMGDHRDDSADSRFHCRANEDQAAQLDNCNPMTSTIAVSAVIGKAFVIAWPPSRWRTLGEPSTFKGLADSGSMLLLAATLGVRRKRAKLRRS